MGGTTVSNNFFRSEGFLERRAATSHSKAVRREYRSWPI
jgi:hypothetical protein